MSYLHYEKKSHYFETSITTLYQFGNKLPLNLFQRINDLLHFWLLMLNRIIFQICELINITRHVHSSNPHAIIASGIPLQIVHI